MKALEALKAARATGIVILIDGDDLVLQASAPPNQSVLDALSRNKAEILALLRPGNDGSSVEDDQALEVEASGISWAEWKAAELNRLFEEQGITGERSRITAATVRHGERHVRRPTGVTRRAVHRAARPGLGDRQ